MKFVILIPDRQGVVYGWVPELIIGVKGNKRIRIYHNDAVSKVLLREGGQLDVYRQNFVSYTPK